MRSRVQTRFRSEEILSVIHYWELIFYSRIPCITGEMAIWGNLSMKIRALRLEGRQATDLHHRMFWGRSVAFSRCFHCVKKFACMHEICLFHAEIFTICIGRRNSSLTFLFVDVMFHFLNFWTDRRQPSIPSSTGTSQSPILHIRELQSTVTTCSQTSTLTSPSINP